MRFALLLLAGGCYAGTTPSGVPCDPAMPSCPAGQACIAAAGGYQCLPEGTPPVVDAAPDSTAVARACPADPALSICLSFDAPQWSSPYANEGALALAANLIAVSRTPLATGGAAVLGPSSEIVFPPNTELVGIVAMDVVLRLDAAVPAGMRVGVVDSDKASPGMSLFIYDGGTTGSHRVRCNIGGMDLYADTTIALGAWIEVGCTCDAGTVAVWRDGVKLAEMAGCSPGQGTTTGLQIGQNSRLGDMLPADEPLVGAIDRVRLWTALPP